MASNPRSQGQAPAEDARSGQNPQAGPQRPPFTKEEIQVLKECNRESFLYRCIPFSIALVGGTAYLTSTGVLTPHPRYGSFFKNLVACFVGYVAGKISYQGACYDKIKERIPDSNLARAMRGEKLIYPQQGIPQMDSQEDPDEAVRFKGSEYGDSRPLMQELDENKRPTLDREFRFVDAGAAGKGDGSVSYDELRRKNRAEYEARMATSPQHPLRQPPFPPPSIGGQPRARAPEPSVAPAQQMPGASGRRNKYGDLID